MKSVEAQIYKRSRTMNWTVFILIAILYIVHGQESKVNCRNQHSNVTVKSCCPLPKFTTEEIRKTCAQRQRNHNQPHVSRFLHRQSKQREAEHEHQEINTDNEGAHAHATYHSLSASHRSHGHGHHHRGGHHHHGHSHHAPAQVQDFWACVLNETGIVPNNGQLSEPKLDEYIGVIFKNHTDIIPVMKQSFQTCAVRREELKSKLQHHHSHRRFLRRSARRRARLLSGRKFMDCVFLEVFVNCPATQWNNTVRCNAKRDHVRECTSQNRFLLARNETPTTNQPWLDDDDNDDTDGNTTDDDESGEEFTGDETTPGNDQQSNVRPKEDKVKTTRENGPQPSERLEEEKLNIDIRGNF